VRRPLGGIAVGVALTVLAAGCGGGGGDEGRAGSQTTVTRFPPTVPFSNKTLSEGQGACGLVSRAEITGAVSLQAQAGSGVETEQGGSSCKWSLPGTNQFVSIILVTRDVPAFEERIRAQGGTIENLAGLGDRAFTVNNTAYVVKGPKLIIVAVATNQAVAARRAATTKLAQTAATRM